MLTFEQLNFRSMDLFENTLLKDLTENGENIMQCALLLFAGYVDHATTFAKGCGGGGSDTLSNWGRGKDEEDEKWAHRCVKMAHRMMKKDSNKKRIRR